MTNSAHPFAVDAVPGPQPEPVPVPEPDPAAALEPLPDLISIPSEFAARIPTQRVLDSLAQIEPIPIGELMATQATRIIAYRALLRDYPERDPTSIWLHSYDVEIEISEMDPTDGKPPTTAPLSPITGT